MGQISGNLLKMETKAVLQNEQENISLVEYQLPLSEQLVPMNQLVGKKIKLEFSGVINCIATGEKIKKSYGQGYSYKAFISLPECDMCIVRPSLCHFSKGTCRDSKWGEENCNISHVLYLARSSGVKVGITREHTIPTRWMDQGAVEAMPLLRFKTRHLSGVMEEEISKVVSDKTNWRKLIAGEIDDHTPLIDVKEQIFDQFGDVIDSLEGEEMEEKPYHFSYPMMKTEESEMRPKIAGLDLEKNPKLESVLLGIRGQYLLFPEGALNIRKHQGYHLQLSY